MILVGDGSGQDWKLGCGWAVAVVERVDPDNPQILYGGASPGTVSLGETLPYLHAMLWYEAAKGREARHRERRALRVHIVTDSQYVANTGTAIMEQKKPRSEVTTHRELWEMLWQFRRRGYDFTFHWLERETLQLNRVVDHISRQARLALKEVEKEVP